MTRAPRTTKTALVEQAAAPERPKRVKRNPELEVALGARIRAARIAAHMSQGALGEAIGLSFQQIQKYEIGKDRVAASTLQLIAATLGVHPGLFFDTDISVVTNALSDVQAVVKLGRRIQRVRDPAVMRRLLALVDLLANIEMEGEMPTAAREGS